ncbi:hypothetical protein ACJX0J_013336, partial [Zea mays]
RDTNLFTFLLVLRACIKSLMIHTSLLLMGFYIDVGDTALVLHNSIDVTPTPMLLENLHFPQLLRPHFSESKGTAYIQSCKCVVAIQINNLGGSLVLLNDMSTIHPCIDNIQEERNKWKRGGKNNEIKAHESQTP